jgi:hypothetical protein
MVKVILNWSKYMIRSHLHGSFWPSAVVATVEEAAAADEAVEALDESDAGDGELPEDEADDDDDGAAVDGEAVEEEADEEDEAYAAVLPEPEHWSTFGA